MFRTFHGSSNGKETCELIANTVGSVPMRYSRKNNCSHWEVCENQRISHVLNNCSSYRVSTLFHIASRGLTSICYGMFVSPPNSYADALIFIVVIFGVRK